MDGYTSERILKQREDSIVELVRDADGVPHIRRTIKRDAREVYFSLKAIKSARIPKIESVELGEDTVVIEEFVDGKTLDELKLTRTFARRDIISIAEQLLSALTDLDAMSVIHRDIKASNIMMADDGRLYLIDFDVARIYRPGADRDTSLAGTRGHAAPEQYGAGQSDARSDIYSVGTVLRELCILADIKKSDPLHRFANSCARFDPVDRFDSAADALAALKKIKRRKLRLAAAAAVLIAVFACALMIAGHARQEQSDDGDVGTEEKCIFWRDKPLEAGLEPFDAKWFRVDEKGKKGFYDGSTYHGLFEIVGGKLRIALSTDEHPEPFSCELVNEIYPAERGDEQHTNIAECLIIDLDCDGTPEMAVSLLQTGRRTVGYDMREESYVIKGVTKIISCTSERGIAITDAAIYSNYLELYKISREDFIRFQYEGGHFLHKFVDGVLYRQALDFEERGKFKLVWVPVE